MWINRSQLSDRKSLTNNLLGFRFKKILGWKQLTYSYLWQSVHNETNCCTNFTPIVVKLYRIKPIIYSWIKRTQHSVWGISITF